MSATDAVQPWAPPQPDGRTSLDLLVAEAGRQLTICNACRYCEGFCAVYPALARRSVLDGGDISQLANLCHDCRACFDACMYQPPHEFAINIPKALSSVRVADYARYVFPQTVPRALRGWSGVASGVLVSSLALLIAAVAHVGVGGLVARHGSTASPYSLVPYGVLLVLMLVPALFAVLVLADAGRRYWSATGGGRLRVADVASAVGQAASMRYLRGGGANCYYPDDETPSPKRRNLHFMVMYGFGLCFVSTVAAGIAQDLLGDDPPYSWVSVPVLTGTAGGVVLLVGSAGMIVLKARSSTVTGFAQMTIKDYGFLVALAFLSLSGLATLLTRTTAAYGLVLLVHLAAIMSCFAATPYTKFAHMIYRFLALVRDNAERASAHTR